MFDLPEAHSQLRCTLRRFANETLQPVAAQIDKEQRFPRSEISLLGEIGGLGVDVPIDDGGAGLDKLAYAIAVEEISRGCASTGAVVSVHHLYCATVRAAATAEQKVDFLNDFAGGTKIGAFAITESCAGTDAAAIRTSAYRDGDEWVLDGAKAFVTNSAQASAVVVFARIADQPSASIDPLVGPPRNAPRHSGISAFLVPLPHPAVTICSADEKLGIRGSSSNGLVLEGCRVPKDALLGEPGEGFKIAMRALDGGRIGMAAQALGIAVSAFELAKSYANERQAFGKPISQFQAIQLKIADMAMRIDAARLMIWRAASLADSGYPMNAEAAMAKIMASETATHVAHQAMQVLGGNGFMKAFAAERHYRDARITEIYEGTSEVLRLVVAKSALSGSPTCW